MLSNEVPNNYKQNYSLIFVVFWFEIVGFLPLQLLSILFTWKYGQHIGGLLKRLMISNTIISIINIFIMLLREQCCFLFYI